MMRALVIFVLGIHMTSAATHTLQYFYTATTGISNFPRFVDVGMLNGDIISMYDSATQRKIPKQKWMAENLDEQYWDSSTEMLKGTEAVYFNSIQVVMSRFNQTAGVHTYQSMYGCEWEDTTEATDGFYQFGFDGEDFADFDLKNSRWVSPKVQAFLVTESKWNNDRGFIENSNNYLKTICIEWLKKYVDYGKETLKRTVSPHVFLLQKDSSSPVSCHATGFYPSGVKITWLKNGQEHEEDVDLGQLLPNEDGTFQRMSTLKVKPDELKQYSCVVEHQGKTIKENKIITNDPSIPLGIILGVIAAVVVLMVVIGFIGYKLYQRKAKSGFVRANTSEGGSDHGSDSSASPPARA